MSESHLLEPHLVTTRLVARLPLVDDAPSIAAYYRENADHLRDSNPTFAPDIFSEPYWREAAARSLDEFEQGIALRLFLFDRNDERVVIGAVNFSAIMRGAAHFCFLGYHLGRKFEGMGLMSEALRAAIDHAFYALNLHRIMANYVPSNERSARLLAKLGFAVEGLARDYLYLDGRWQDHVLTSLTNPRWRSADL